MTHSRGDGEKTNADAPAAVERGALPRVVRVTLANGRAWEVDRAKHTRFLHVHSRGRKQELLISEVINAS
jgi:hypothetical protein